MNDRNLNQWINNSLPELPPDDIAATVTPWKKFIYYILAGLILNTITIPYFYLQYILPFIGDIFLVVGFQAFRLENNFFKMGWKFSIINFLTLISLLILKTTLYQEIPGISAIVLALGFAKIICFYSLYRCLAFGIKEVNRECGLKLDYNIERRIMGCCTLLIFVSITSIDGLLVNVVLILTYIVLIWNLIKLLGEIKDTGYAIHVVPMLISGKMIGLVSVLILAAGFAIGYTHLDTYRVNAVEWQNSTAERIEDAKAHLLGLGFPSEMIDDISDKDLLVCENAEQVIVGTMQKMKDSDAMPNEFIAHNVAVKLPNQEYSYKIFHYYTWTEEAKLYGTECIVLWPGSKGDTDSWKMTTECTGHLLYEEEGTTYMFPYEDIERTSRYLPELDAYSGAREIIAEFSYPNNAEKCRGYLTYQVTGTSEWHTTYDTWMTYLHRTDKILFPTQTAGDYWRKEYMREGTEKAGFDVFETVIHYFLKER